MNNTMVCNYCDLPDTEFCSTCKSTEQKEIKTLEGWRESKINSITDYLNQGDQIDEELYNYFLDIMPPISLNSGNGIVFAGFQVSEPYGDRRDINDKWRTTYSTFGCNGGHYYYLGLNFKGKVKSEYKNNKGVS